MSRYFSDKFKSLVPYVPGEQPQDKQYIKLNTNESPFPPSKMSQDRANHAATNLQLYSDPDCRLLREMAAVKFQISPDEIIFTNGSDEILNFLFMCYCDQDHGAVFPDITYGFYEVFAQLNQIPYRKIPLREDFTLCVEDYIGLNETIFIANPNAPTGISLSLEQIEQIVKGNPNGIVVIDEAYVDFGAESAIPLIHKYDNLVVTQTFSKSRSMAGARLGFGVACKALIQDLNTIRFSTNPYNVNAMTMAAGIGALEDAQYFRNNCKLISENREWTAKRLREMGFSVLDSVANFLFVMHPDISGEALYLSLKNKGILVRHFHQPRLKEYNRITIGTADQMKKLCAALKEILEDAV